MIESSSTQLPGIQMLRGIAAMMVVFHHAIGMSLVNGFGYEQLKDVKIGGAGVDLFFIISGFIIEYTAGRNSSLTRGGFLIRRAIRIVPLCWALTIAAFAISFITPLNTGLNYQTFALSMLFLPDAGGKYIIPMAWSLTYEWIFYLLYAVFLPFSPANRLIALTIIFVGGSFIGAAIKPESHLLQDFVNPINIEFLMGVFCAHLLRSGYRIHSGVAVIVGAWAVLGLIAASDADPMSFKRVTTLGVMFAAIVYATVLSPIQIKDIFMRDFVRLGDISYSLYLSHFFTLALYARMHKYLDFLPRIAEWILMIALCILVARICYITIEQPSRRYLSMQLRR